MLQHADLIQQNLQQVQRRIAQAIALAGRPDDCVQLLAVSKKKPQADIRLAHAFGQTQFGESYLQEAEPKINALLDLNLTWHFIGRLQRNKTNSVAQYFDWVHSVDREDIAQRLSHQRSPQDKPLQVLIQVNPDEQAGKGGVAPDGVERLAQAVSTMPQLQLRGLMTIPQPSTERDQRRKKFATVAACYDRLIEKGYTLDTLSMGMSYDLEDAIAEGATLVRIGTAIFGARE